MFQIIVAFNIFFPYNSHSFIDDSMPCQYPPTPVARNTVYKVCGVSF